MAPPAVFKKTERRGNFRKKDKKTTEEAEEVSALGQHGRKEGGDLAGPCKSVARARDSTKCHAAVSCTGANAHLTEVSLLIRA
jgi:hypothetical protein